MNLTSPGKRIAGAACLAVLAALTQAHANPTSPTVISGTASFATSGNTLTVTNSNGTIINWAGFSIGAGEATRFNQPGASSAVLNRVLGSAGSSIMGSLTSNGNVFLINPNGVLFGAGSQVSVGGLAVSTGDISNANFLAGNYVFGNTGTGDIVANGSISVTGNLTLVSSGAIVVGGPIQTGGNVTLDGSGQVVQLSTISSGSISLAGSNSVTVGGGGPTGTLVLTNSPGGTGGIVLASGRPAAQANTAPPATVADIAGNTIGGPVVVASLAFNLEKREPGF